MFPASFSSLYRGRLAPSPTGYLHLGHARTFWLAWKRAREARGGVLRLRVDDLDQARCRPEFLSAMREDLIWLGLNWDGAIVTQSRRLALYHARLARLHAAGLIFPCDRSRRDVQEAAGAPHEGGADDEPVYPKEFRPPIDAPLPPLDAALKTNWRFRVPDGETLTFNDGHFGLQTAVCGVDFGDFLVWRKDGFPSYQLASAVDDIELGITEVVRGADLIKSTFRQQLLFRALAAIEPKFYHCPLVLDEHGERLAKRHDSLSLRALRAQGVTPESILQKFAQEETERTEV